MQQSFSKTAIDHALNPQNTGELPRANGNARITGPCGDTMEIWVRIENQKIREASFWTDGCGTTIASGSMVTELSKGKPVAQALKIGQQEVLEALDGLPDESKHCALLAANTLKAAINDYLASEKEPWKRLYRK